MPPLTKTIVQRQMTVTRACARIRYPDPEWARKRASGPLVQAMMSLRKCRN